MDVFLDKYYDLVDSENLDDFFIFIGLGYLARKVALTLKQTVRLGCNEDGNYTFEFISPLTCSTIVFRLGVEFNELRPDGVTVKSVITIDNNVMTHIQTDSTGRKCTHVREFYPDKMITTTIADGLNKTVLRNYKAQLINNGEELSSQ